MPKDGHNREKRHKDILAMLLQRQHMTIPELCGELHCSEATIRNDLRGMERDGLLKRVYGGVMSTGNTALKTGVTERITAFQSEKIAISRHVADKYIAPGLTIVLDTGSTALELAKLIARLPYRINVLTNSLPAAHAISLNERHVLHLAGGGYDPMVGGFQDQDALRYMDSLHAEVFFMCPTGVSPETGFAVPDRREMEIKQLMMQRSNRVIALADHSKLNKSSFYSVCGLDRVDVLVTDSLADDAAVAALADSGCRCEIAEAMEKQA